MTSEIFKKANADSLIKQMRRGFIILKADENNLNDSSLYEIIDINSSVKDLVGKKNQDLVGSKIAEIIPLKNADLEILAYVMHTGQSQQFEYYVKRMDEWLLISIHHSRNNYLTVIFENITEKKLTEQKLIDSEKTMRLTLEVTGEGIWEWRKNDSVKHNEQWCHILGLDEKYLIHHVDTYVDRIHPDDREGVMDRVYKAIETQEIIHHEYRMVRTDGTVIWVEDRGVAVIDSDGNFERMIGSLNEITDFIQTQERLNLEKELLKSTLLSVGDGVIATDVKGNITIINPVAEEFSGWKVTEVLGENIADVFQMIDTETNQTLYCFITPDSPENKYKKIQNRQASVTSRYGEEYIMNCSISPIRLSDNKLSGFIIIFRDITDVVEYQKEIEYMSYHDDLTGLYNRRFARGELKRLDMPEYFPLTIMVIDINNLKQANDYYGHVMGDHLIQKTAHILKGLSTHEGIISRIGGDEFLILLPKTSEEKANKLKGKILSEMKNYKLNEIQLSVAIGHSTKNRPIEDVEETLRVADNNMYTNKKSIKR